jgi:integrase
MSKKNFVFQTYPIDQDLSKQWFIKYRLGALESGKWMKANVPSLKTLKGRVAAAKSLEGKLEANGWKPIEKKKIKVNSNYIAQAFELLDSRKGTLSSKSFSTMYSHIKVLNDYCLVKGISSLTHAVADQFLDKMMNEGLHPKTVNNYRISLSSTFNLLLKRGKIRKNPFAETEKKKGESECPNWFKAHEFERLELYMREHKPFLWAAARWVFYCLMRPGSTLRYVKVGDVDWTRWMVKLKYSNTKNSRSYWVFIPDELKEELQTLNLHTYPSGYYLVGPTGEPSENPVYEHYWYNNFREILIELGFDTEGYYFYCLKHTGFAHAYLNGADIVSLKEHAGHSDIRHTYLYMRRLGLEDDGRIRSKFKKLIK